MRDALPALVEFAAGESMFDWFNSLFGGKGRPSSPTLSASQSAVLRSAQAASMARAASVPHAPSIASTPSHPHATPSRSSDQPYLDTLAAELGEPVLLTPAEEQRVSQLVESVVRYCSMHEIEPPVMPAIATRMLALLRAENVDVVALSRLIEQDPATSAKVMSIANSALFRGPSEIRGLREAIVFLGTEQVAHIAVGLATRALFESPKRKPHAQGGDRFARLFGHAMTTAFTACHLASKRNRNHSEAAFLGGLFHDVGKAAALRALNELLDEQRLDAPSDVVIDAVLQMIHSEPTSTLYDSWNLPRPLMAMCKNHHRLSHDAEPELHFVRIVSGLDTLHTGSAIEKREVLQEIAESQAALKMSDAQLRVANTETHEYGERVKAMFG